MMMKLNWQGAVSDRQIIPRSRRGVRRGGLGYLISLWRKALDVQYKSIITFQQPCMG